MSDECVNQIKISVIIPVYNVEKYLRECLDSVVNQTLKEIEIILVDDGSTDLSGEICDEYAAKDERIKVIHKKNEGTGIARNTAIEFSTGEYIFFLDSDDLIELTVLEKLYIKTIETNSDIVISQTKLIFDKECLNIEEKLAWYDEYFDIKPIDNLRVSIDNFGYAVKIPVVVWGKLYRSKFLKENNLAFINKNVPHEDDGFLVKVLSCFPDISIISDIGVLYRIRNTSIMSNMRVNKLVSDKNRRVCLKEAFDYVRNNISGKNANLIIFKIQKFYLRTFFFPLALLRKILKKLRIFDIDKFMIDKKNACLKCITTVLSNELKDKIISFRTNNDNLELENELRNAANFLFLPNKGNLGDVVIAASEFEYFNSKNIKYEVYDITDSERYNKHFNFVYGGGGLWHPLYKKSYQEITEIFKSPLLQKCIILPSSFYKCEDVITLMDERFTVFCREKQSYEYCKQLNSKAKFILANDMVIDADFDIFQNKIIDCYNLQKFKKNDLQMLKKISGVIYPYWQKVFEKVKNEFKDIDNYKIGYLLRRDQESNINIDSIKLNRKAVDLSSLGGSYCCDIGLDFILANLFLAVIDMFDIIVTDRLHVGICAAKLQKTVFLIDNSYKKVSSVYDFSLKNFENVHLTTSETLEEDIRKYSPEAVAFKEPKTEMLSNLPENLDDFLVYYGSFQNSYGCEKRLINISKISVIKSLIKKIIRPFFYKDKH